MAKNLLSTDLLMPKEDLYLLFKKPIMILAEDRPSAPVQVPSAPIEALNPEVTPPATKAKTKSDLPSIPKVDTSKAPEKLPTLPYSGSFVNRILVVVPTLELPPVQLDLLSKILMAKQIDLAQSALMSCADESTWVEAIRTLRPKWALSFRGEGLKPIEKIGTSQVLQAQKLELLAQDAQAKRSLWDLMKSINFVG